MIKKILTGLLFVFSFQNALIFNMDKKDAFITIIVPGFGTPPDNNFLMKYDGVFISPAFTTFIQLEDALCPKKSFNRIISSFVSIYKLNINFNRESSWINSKDLDDIHETIIKTTNLTQDMIIFAYCKSATTIIHYVAKYNPKNLRALVLECPFYDLLETTKFFLLNTGIPEQYYTLLWDIVFPLNSLPHVQMTDLIQQIENKQLPILFLHSKTDTYIPIEQGFKFYTSFKKNNFDHVYLAILEGSHCESITMDKDNYLTAAHTFYKNYGFGHNPKYAISSLNNYTHDLDFLENHISKENIILEKQYLAAQKKLKNLIKTIKL